MIDELAILHDLVQKREIRTVFQPIVDVTNASVVGYEALSRGPKGSPLERPDILFEAKSKSSVRV